MLLLGALFVATTALGAPAPARLGLDLFEGSRVLDEGWLYRVGDGEWAAQSLDESEWSPIDASDKLARTKGVVWFRRHLEIDSKAWRRSVPAFMEVRGSARVFLDGVQVRRIGEHAPAAAEAPPGSGGRFFALELPSRSRVVMAVRYDASPRQGLDWMDPFWGFRLTLGGEASIMSKVARVSRIVGGHQMLFLGAFGGQTLLHFLLWVFNPRIRSNAYFTLTTACAAALVGLHFERVLSDDPQFVALWYRIWNVLLIVTMLTLVRFAYEVFDRKPRWVFFGLSGIGLVVMAVVWMSPDFDAFYDFWWFQLLALGETLRSTVGAMRDRRSGAWIISVGIGILAVCLVWQFLLVAGFSSTPFSVFPIAYYGVGGLLLSVSVYLAFQFARMGRTLRTRLVQVQELSAKTLEQELAAKELEVERRLLEAESDRKSEELEGARELQLALLPAGLPEIPGLEVAASILTATEVGGDFFDFRVGETGSLTVAIGDATGHGARAGAMVSLVKGLFAGFEESRDLPAFLAESSDRIRALNLDGALVAMAIARLRDGRFTLASAGMPPALVYRSADGTVEELQVEGMPLGGIADFRYREIETDLRPGDQLLLLSDGLPELLGETGEVLGYERTRDLVKENGGEDADELVARLNQFAEDWSSGPPFLDDITFVAIKLEDP